MTNSRSFSRPTPLVNIAAIGVIIASLTAIAGVMGLIPSAFSQRATVDQAAALVPADESGPCRQCGVVESVRQIQVKSAVAAAAPAGNPGSIVGSQFGNRGGHGALGYASDGAKTWHADGSYRVTVRMGDGTARTVYQASPPGMGVGEKVRVINGELVAGR